MLLPNVDYSKRLPGVFSKYHSEGRSVAISWAFLSILGGTVSEQAPCFVGLRTCWALLCLIPSQRARYVFELSKRSRSCRCEAWTEEALLQCKNELRSKKKIRRGTHVWQSPTPSPPIPQAETGLSEQKRAGAEESQRSQAGAGESAAVLIRKRL